MIDRGDLSTACLRALVQFNARVERISGFWFGDLGVERAASFHLCEALFDHFQGHFKVIPELTVSNASGRIGAIDVILIEPGGLKIAAAIELKRDQYDNESDIDRLMKLRLGPLTAAHGQNLTCGADAVLAVASIWHAYAQQGPAKISAFHERVGRYGPDFSWTYISAKNHRGQEHFGATVYCLPNGSD
jgi:hypothetical protein